MDEFKILEELNKLDDDIEPGFLRDLQQRAPEELHSRIMNSIRQEAVIKKRFNFNYKRYASFATAAALLVVTILAGINHNLVGNNLIKNNDQMSTPPISSAKIAPSNPDKKPVPKPITVDQQKTAQDDPQTTTKNINAGQTDKNTGKTKTEKVISDKDLAAATGNKAGINASSDVKVPSSDKPSTDKQPVVAKGKSYAKTTDDRSVTITPGTKTKPSGDSSAGIKNQPAIADNNAAGGSQTGDNNPGNTTTNQPGASVAANNAGSNISTSGDNDTPALKAPVPDDFIANPDNVNFEVSLNLSETYIIQFIQEIGQKISNDSYRFNVTDFNTLKEMLKNSSITMKQINEITGDSVVIKMIVY